MKNLIISILIIIIIGIVGCDGDNSSTPPPVTESIITVDAGEDQIVEVGSTVSLSGSMSWSNHSDDILTYSWSFVSAPDDNVVFDDFTSINPSFETNIAGNYIIRLTINNDPENIDEVTIIVATEISGIIDENTTWGLDNSPYLIIDKLQIAYGTTLQINADVEIFGKVIDDGYGYFDYMGNIEVFGILNVVGSENKMVKFHDVYIKGESNFWEEYFELNFNYIEMVAGGLYGSVGAAYGSISLKSSILIDPIDHGYPGETYNSSYMNLRYPISDCIIENNIFINWGRICTELNENVKVYITRNVFYNYASNYAIENRVSNGTSETIVEFNSFLDQDKIAVRLVPGDTSAYIKAENNYWGTTDETIIETMIFDLNDDLGCADYIPYIPYLTEPDPSVPDITPYLTED